jgi:hypothetical protein
MGHHGIRFGPAQMSQSWLQPSQQGRRSRRACSDGGAGRALTASCLLQRQRGVSSPCLLLLAPTAAVGQLSLLCSTSCRQGWGSRDGGEGRGLGMRVDLRRRLVAMHRDGGVWEGARVPIFLGTASWAAGGVRVAGPSLFSFFLSPPK